MFMQLQLPAVKNLGPFEPFNARLLVIEFEMPLTADQIRYLSEHAKFYFGLVSVNPTLTPISPECRDSRTLELWRRTSDKPPPEKKSVYTALLQMHVIDRATFLTRMK